MRIIQFCILAAANATAAHAAQLPCSQPGDTVTKMRFQRPLEARDLIELRDIGLSGASDAPLAMSPDGRHAAFQVRRASISSNNYCFAMVILDLDHPTQWRIVDTGGEVMLDKTPWDGRILDIANGVPRTAVPKWSPDGQSIAYLRRDNGVTQVWRAGLENGVAAQLTMGLIDVEDFSWSPDGKSIIFTTRPNLAASRVAIAAEARLGFHYDDRFFPFEDRRPIATDGHDPEVRVVDILTGIIRNPTAEELLRIHQSAADLGHGAGESRGRSKRLSVRIRPADPARVFLADTIDIWDRDRQRLPCDGAPCRGAIKGAWWGKDGALYFLKRDGWARSKSSLFRWTVSVPRPKRLLSTDDLITGCDLAGNNLVCVAESSLRPRHIISIDLPQGRIRAIFDPNPDFEGFALNPVRRLHWINQFGIETFGDLVLPRQRDPRVRLPLVIVQYDSRGFLRGGTGDEVPIQLLAQSGIAVLSFQRPRDYGEFLPAQSGADLSRGDFRDLMDRRSVNSSLTTGIRMLVDNGIVDSSKVGISGLSDGASTVQYALVNGVKFAAVGMAQCCEEDESRAYGGPSVSQHFQAYGVPEPGDRENAYWKKLSMVQAAGRINVPILIQISDTEYLDALQPWTILRTLGKPVDMFVFPGEHHIKLEPIHRLAVYDRYLAWFGFWLQGRSLPFTAPEDLARWQQWKTTPAIAVASDQANAAPKLLPQGVPASADSKRHD